MSVIIFYYWYSLYTCVADCFDWRPIGAPLPANAVPCAVIVDGLTVWRDVPRCESWQYEQFAAIVRRAEAMQLRSRWT